MCVVGFQLCIDMPCGVVMNITSPPSRPPLYLSLPPSVHLSPSHFGLAQIPGAMEHGITSDDIFWLKEAPGKTLAPTPLPSIQYTHTQTSTHAHTPKHTNEWDTQVRYIPERCLKNHAESWIDWIQAHFPSLICWLISTRHLISPLRPWRTKPKRHSKNVSPYTDSSKWWVTNRNHQPTKNQTTKRSFPYYNNVTSLSPPCSSSTPTTALFLSCYP